MPPKDEETSLESALARPREVRVLRIEGGARTFLPPAIGTLSALEELHASGNRLTGLPPEIGKLTKLRVLDVRRNRLTRLPDELARLKSLEVLRASVNQIRVMPELGALSGLKELDLGPNPPIVRPPEWIWGLTGLRTLNLFRVPLARYPATAFAKLKALEHLEIGEPGDLLEHDRPIPESLWTLPALKSLSIFGASSTAIPPAIAGLKSLRSLSIVETRVTSLPKELAILTNLKELTLDDNRLKSLPDLSALAGTLKKLSVTGNALSADAVATLRASLPTTEIETD